MTTSSLSGSERRPDPSLGARDVSEAVDRLFALRAGLIPWRRFLPSGPLTAPTPAAEQTP